MSEMSLWTFVSHADGVVKTVLLLLMTASLVSWTIIFQRSRLLRRTERLIHQFEEAFWSGAELSRLYQKISESHSDLSRIFHAGFGEFQKCRARPTMPPALVIENCQRAMRVAEQRCLQELEQHVSLLATIGSTAPYVGLFGTVWGIMASFQSLGHVQQATIAMVAPGISEALIATAIGLFAAIPAVVFYNRFANHIDQLGQKYAIFQDELTSILQQEAV